MMNGRRLMAIIIAVMIVVPAIYCWAAPKSDKKANEKAATMVTPATAEMSQQEAMASIRETYPKFRVDELRKTSVPGIWEIVAGQNIVYFEPRSKTLIFGEFVQKDGTNLTQVRRGQLSEKAIKTLPLAKAIKIGNGPNVVIIFTDLECPYCKKVAAYMREHSKEVTQYVFFMPIHSLTSRTKAAYILASKDPAITYNEVDQDKVQGVDWKTYKVTDDIDLRLKEYMEESQKLSIRGTPNMWINGKNVAGANMTMIETLIKEKK